QWTSVQPCNYFIFTDSVSTYSKNCDTGAISFSGTNPTTVIQSTIGAMNDRETLLIRGNYNITNAVIVNKPINYKHEGRVTLIGSDPYLIFNFTTQSKPSVDIWSINAQDKSRD